MLNLGYSKRREGKTTKDLMEMHRVPGLPFPASVSYNPPPPAQCLPATPFFIEVYQSWLLLPAPKQTGSKSLNCIVSAYCEPIEITLSHDLMGDTACSHDLMGGHSSLT